MAVEHPSSLASVLLILAAAGCGEGGSRVDDDAASEPTGWTVQELGTDAEFRGVFFLDARRGWIVGGGHSIQGGIVGSTEDGGLTWRFRSGIARPSRRAHLFHLHAVQFLDERTGVVVGSGGIILRTVDGGEHWHQVRRGPVWAHLRDLQFVDRRNGWAAGGTTLLRTADGGRTWSSPTTPDAEPRFSAQAIHFLDTSRGWAVGSAGRMLRTEDGGRSWSAIGDPPRSGRPDLRSVHFVDADHGWVAGEDGTILHTSDGGVSWTSQQSRTCADLTAVRFVDPRLGWAVGFRRADSTSTVLHTVDGGLEWAPQLRLEGEELWALFLTDARHAWAVGERVRPVNQRLLRYESREPA